MNSRILIALAIVTLLSACGDRKGIFRTERPEFDGFHFRARATGTDKADITRFISAAGPVEQSLPGAREAAEHEATRYCITNVGNSRIKWTIGPDTPDSELETDGGQVIYTGRCRR